MRASPHSSSGAERAPWLLYPVLVYLVVLAIGPLVILLIYSFYRQSGYDMIRGFSIHNYQEIVTNALYLSLTGKSLMYGASVCAVTLLVGYPTARFIAWHAGKWKNLYLMGLLIPLYTGDLIRVYAWRIILGLNGVLNTTLLELGVISEPIEALLFSDFSVLISMIYVYLPFMVLPIWASLEGLDKDLIEASMDLGAGRYRTFTRIVLPLIMPGILAGGLLVFIPVTGEYLSPNLLGGTSGITLMNVITSQFGAAFNWPLGSALAWFLLFIVASILGLTAYLVTRITWVRSGIGGVS